MLDDPRVPASPHTRSARGVTEPSTLAAYHDLMPDDDRFWSLIEGARAGRRRLPWARPDPDEDRDEHFERVKAALRELSNHDLITFKVWLDAQIGRAYRWDLWDAAYLLMGGCGDDSFEYFRCWLIAQGRDAFESALRDPDTLADLPIRGDPMNVCHFESFMYAPAYIYEERTGRDLYDDLPPMPRIGEPEGTHEPDEGRLAARFPHIARKWSPRR